MWFLVAFAGYFLLATVMVMDKFILTKTVSKPVVYTFYSTIFMFGALLAWPLGVDFLIGFDWFLAIISGVSFGFGLWTLFSALKTGETSHISPFNGAIVTVFTYFLSSSFLGEELTRMQMSGMVVLVFASFLLSFEKSHKHSGFHVGFLWAIISGVLFAVSHVSAKYLYNIYPFLTGFIWTRASIGLVGLFTLFFPSVRKSFHVQKKKKDKKHPVLIITVDKVLAVLSVVLIQYASAIGNVSLIIALSGMQFVMMFVMIYILTKVAPKVFKEYFTKQELAVEVIAVILVAIGSALFVV